MDVYDDSPTIVTIWLTIMPKISILIFLLQLLIAGYYQATVSPAFIQETDPFNFQA